MSTQQTAVALGLGAGLGILLLFNELIGRLTRQPHAVTTAERLTGVLAGRPDTGAHDVEHAIERLGMAVLRRTAGSALLHIPFHDLALTRTSAWTLIGRRVLGAAIGLAAPATASAVAGLFGLRPPIVLPVGAGIVFAIILSYLPVLSVRRRAARTRAQFRTALTAYIDLVALERAAGSGATQALESAARVGHSEAFQRVRDELSHARWAGVPAWDALHNLGTHLRLPDLTETAAVMRMSAREGATVYHLLRSRAVAMRGELLAADHAGAGTRNERATVPMAITAVVFMLILAVPVALQIG